MTTRLLPPSANAALLVSTTIGSSTDGVDAALPFAASASRSRNVRRGFAWWEADAEFSLAADAAAVAAAASARRCRSANPRSCAARRRRCLRDHIRPPIEHSPRRVKIVNLTPPRHQPVSKHVRARTKIAGARARADAYRCAVTKSATSNSGRDACTFHGRTPLLGRWVGRSGE